MAIGSFTALTGPCTLCCVVEAVNDLVLFVDANSTLPLKNLLDGPSLLGLVPFQCDCDAVDEPRRHVSGKFLALLIQEWLQKVRVYAAKQLLPALTLVHARNGVSVVCDGVGKADEGDGAGCAAGAAAVRIPIRYCTPRRMDLRFWYWLN